MTTERKDGTMTTQETDGRLEQATDAAKRQRLRELEAELESAGAMVGQTAIAYEQAKWSRDRALKRHNRAMGMHERFLSGEDG